MAARNISKGLRKSMISFQYLKINETNNIFQWIFNFEKFNCYPNFNYHGIDIIIIGIWIRIIN
jgi:hypothetical protein